jgi:hypothetical protein
MHPGFAHNAVESPLLLDHPARHTAELFGLPRQRVREAETAEIFIAFIGL